MVSLHRGMLSPAATAKTSRLPNPCPRNATSVHSALISVQPGGCQDNRPVLLPSANHACGPEYGDDDSRRAPRGGPVSTNDETTGAQGAARRTLVHRAPIAESTMRTQNPQRSSTSSVTAWPV